MPAVCGQKVIFCTVTKCNLVNADLLMMDPHLPGVTLLRGPACSTLILEEMTGRRTEKGGSQATEEGTVGALPQQHPGGATQSGGTGVHRHPQPQRV